MDSITTFAKVKKNDCQKDIMEKEALLKIILQDIKELETLLNTFTGKPAIPKTFINLTKSKVKGILEEIDLLESLAEQPSFLKITAKEEPDAAPRPVEKNEEPTPKIKHEIPEFQSSVKLSEPEQKVQEIKEVPYIAPSVPQPEKQEILLAEPVKIKQPEKKKDISKETQHAVLGEQLGKDTLSFNEILAQKKDGEVTPRFQSKPIDDLKKGIGINDRFYFQRELFNGSSELMNQTLEQLNHMDSFNSADSFLTANFTWESNNDAVKAFKELVRRRYL